MSRQYNILKKVTSALIETVEKENYSNETTLKYNFFHHLKLKNKNYEIRVEENLRKHVNLDGRVDYYLNDQTSSYRNDVVIEFKVNCKKPTLIKHDLNKLENIKRLNNSIATIFVNVFTSSLNFQDYLSKTKKLFENTKVYCITIAPEIKGFFIREGSKIVERKLEGWSFIINNARFIETHLIPTKYNVIRIPNKGGLLKIFTCTHLEDHYIEKETKVV